MSKPADQSARILLPDDWAWAEWSQTAATEAIWHSMDKSLQRDFIHRFREIVAAKNCGRPLSHEKNFIIKNSGGIAKAKIFKPRPGWRAWYFQDGKMYHVSHFSPKAKDHDKQVGVAQAAKKEHFAKKSKGPK